MHGGARDIEINRTRAHPVDRAAWAVALNKTAHPRQIWVTLLALAVVDDEIPSLASSALPAAST